jgi:uncharacterized protein (TIGR00251 family)
MQKGERLDLKDGQGFCTLAVKVIPRSAKNLIMGVENGALKLKLTAPPVDGAANEAVINFLSKWLGKPRNCIELMKGQQSRNKLVRLAGVKTSDVLEAIGKLKK